MEAEHHMLRVAATPQTAVAATLDGVSRPCMSSDPHQISVWISNTAVCTCGFNQADDTWFLATYIIDCYNSTLIDVGILW